MSSSANVNPFYIESQDDYDEEWEYDDTGDLENLLQNDQNRFRNPSMTRNTTRHHSDNYQDFSGQRRSICLGLVVIIVLLALVSENSTDGRYQPIPVETIAILGERNSGMEWVYEQVHSCFNVEVTSTLQRKGYFFQDEPSFQRPSTLVVAVYRNPYDWVQLMRAYPVYAPLHNSSLSWRDFVTTPWTMERPTSDLLVKDRKHVECQEEFDYDRVVSCIPSKEHNAIYEMQPDSNPYDNVVDLRAAKIANFQSTAQWSFVTHVLDIRYESLQSNGIHYLLNLIRDATGLDYNCSATESPPHEVPLEITQDYFEWMNHHVDWGIENQIGYHKLRKVPSPRPHNDETKQSQSESNKNNHADEKAGEDQNSGSKESTGFSQDAKGNSDSDPDAEDDSENESDDDESEEKKAQNESSSRSNDADEVKETRVKDDQEESQSKEKTESSKENSEEESGSETNEAGTEEEDQPAPESKIDSESKEPSKKDGKENKSGGDNLASSKHSETTEGDSKSKEEKSKKKGKDPSKPKHKQKEVDEAESASSGTGKEQKKKTDSKRAKTKKPEDVEAVENDEGKESSDEDQR